MSNQSRKDRGMETQKLVTLWFRARGWPHAESAGSGRPGVDVLGMPGLAPEVKARRQLNLTAWLKQAKAQPGLPFVVHRPDGYGEARLADWPVTMRLEDFTQLLHDAGYGG